MEDKQAQDSDDDIPTITFDRSDLQITKEETIEVQRARSDIRNNNLIHWTALAIIALVSAASLVGLFVFPEQGGKLDTASKLLFLIVGSVSGFIYGVNGQKK